MIALIGAKPVPLASRTIGLARVLAQEEAAERAFDAQDLLVLHRAEDMVGELAARHVADVQLDGRRAAQPLRRVGHAVAAAQPVRRMNSMYCPARYCRFWLAGSCRRSTATSGAGRSMASTRVGIFSTGNSPQSGHAARFDHAVGLRRGAAGEDVAGRFLGRRQCLELVHAMDHAAFEQPALARAAGAVAAAVGQADALADRGREDDLVAVDLEAAPGGLQGDRETSWQLGRTLKLSRELCPPAARCLPPPAHDPCIAPCAPTDLAHRGLRRRRPARAAPACSRAGACSR